MLFRKKKPDTPRRARQPLQPGRAGAKPVFSYHAQSARTESANGSRRATKLLWTNSTEQQQSPRRAPRHRARRGLFVSAAILVAVLGLNSLFLGQTPEVVIVASSGSHALLRSQDVYSEAAHAVLAGSWTNTNKLTIDTKQVARTIQERFPELESVAVVLPVIGRKPVVHIQPSQPALLLKGADAAVFVLDQNGRAVMEAVQVRGIEKLGLAVVEDQSGLPAKLGQGVLPHNDITFITEVVGQLKAKSIKISGLLLPQGASELDVRVEGTPYIIKFNLHGDARAEAGAYLAVKQHLEQEHKTPGTYIDVRVDNKAYYR